MEKNSKILDRIKYLDFKFGRNYADTDGELFKVLKILYIVFFAYYSFISAVITILMCFHLSDGGNISSEKLESYLNYEKTVAFFFAFAVLGFVLYFLKLKIAGLAVNIVSMPIGIIIISKFFDDGGLSLLGFYSDFYWKHLIPALLVFAVSVWMFVIVLREKIRIEKAYKKFTGILYERYNKKFDTLSDGEWEDFLKNYDPASNSDFFS